jgi:SAM-dependent methyltransferase
VRELLPLLPMGPALDLACGTGRHSLLLASRHQPVTAVDGSKVALDVLERRARDLHFGVNRSRTGSRIESSSHGIELVYADLEHLALPASSFSLILCVHYLQRSLFAGMQAALMPGGMLLFETYTRAQVESAGGPKNPAYLLEIGELRTAFPGLRIIFYRELRAGKGIASLIAQKAV